MKLPFTIVCLALLTACGDPSASTVTRAPGEQPTEKTTSSVVDTAQLSEIESKVVVDAQSVLALHLNLKEVNAVDLILIRDRQWPDGGLGCSQAGMYYTQSLVPGYKVVLELAGTQHHVHMVKSGGGLVCERLQDSVLEVDAPSRADTDPALIPQAK